MTTTSEERREVAERLRLEAGEWHRRREDDDIFSMSDSDSTESILFAFGFCDTAVPVYELLDKIADAIDRPTCRNVSGYQDVFECSECKCKVELITEVYNEYGEPFSMSLMPSFCPDCGAEVIGND